MDFGDTGMACFLAPMALAIATTLIQKIARGLAERLKLGLLNAMLWGGVILLALEHIWHGEVVPWPPFLTAMTSPADIPIMIHEIATTGVAMNIAVLAVWGSILAISHRLSTAAKAPASIEPRTGIHGGPHSR